VEIRMYKFILVIFLTISTNSYSSDFDCDALRELSQIMSGKVSESKYYKDVNFSNAHKVTFSLNSLASDLNITERIFDASNFIVERYHTDFSGNLIKEKVTLNKAEYFLRLELVKQFVDENKAFPRLPLQLK
jgi:hypothetical protein